MIDSALFSACTHTHALDDSVSHDDLEAPFSALDGLLGEDDRRACDPSPGADESSLAVDNDLPGNPSAALLYRRDLACYSWRTRPQTEQEEQAQEAHDLALIERARAGDLAAREEMITSLLHHVERKALRCFALLSWASPHFDALDLVQAGSEAMLGCLNHALLAEQPFAYLLSVAYRAIRSYSHTYHSLICTPATPGTPPLPVESLDAPIVSAEGTIRSTRFIGGGREIAGIRSRQLGRIARSRSRTGLIATGEQDNVALWRKIRTRDEAFAHLVSRRCNRKRAFWMKGRIFRYAKYKAWHEGIITSRVSPHNTSRECARCHAPIVRYAQGQPEEGYTPGAPLMLCKECDLRGHADRNASVVIGQRLITRYQEQQTQEKPLAPLLTERESKDSGVGGSHEPETEAVGHSSHTVWHGISNGHGTAHERAETDGSARSDMPPPLRCSPSWGYAPSTPNSAYGSVSEAAGL